MLLMPLASLLLFAPALENTREQRPLGLVLAPGIAVHGSDAIIMPVGFAIDYAVGAHVAVTLGTSHFPSTDGDITNVYLGARLYLLRHAFSPYLSGDVDLQASKTESQDIRRDPGILGGGGLEWASHGGSLCAMDFSIGLQHVDAGGQDRAWELFRRGRLIVGVRF